MNNTFKRGFYTFALLGAALLSVQCKSDKKQTVETEVAVESTPLVTISKKAFGMTSDSIAVDQYTLKNEKGMEVSIITFGGIITNWTAPDKNNNYKDVVLGYETLAPYETNPTFFGALIGRYGNRIANGKFSLNGEEYALATNDGSNHLHGGTKGFDKVVWTASETQTDSTASLVLTYLSKDMEEGYPGNLNTKVVYTLDNNNALRVDYEAITDKPTIVNLTQHSYFNLTGDFSKTILNHKLSIDADQFVPVNETLIPTGELVKVEGTPFDFRTAKPIGQDINIEDVQLKRGLGYDHCWVLNKQDAGERSVAIAYDEESGRVLEVISNEPGIQLYTGNFLDGTLPSKQGGNYEYRTGLCLETQHYPDSPNQPDFPSTTLNPGETYKSATIFKFTTK
ncbi:aldose epimerase family protein [Aestuariibaculum suncheonense]|uniref:Aldose 1-epimerase n=1 Tax=Aestuariibaculum suncheonense TaxID=1028745 RepID=A0A8J6UCP2_9FLAO|nr:aldose epimerase family protein [Aestuariibaculum suncheonense]MBD0836805.1 galactose mutarotase [Aestuariibaculum suncheonense]